MTTVTCYIRAARSRNGFTYCPLYQGVRHIQYTPNMDQTNWKHSLLITEPIRFAEEPALIALHLRSEDIPKWTLEGAPLYLTEIYKFWALIHRIFVSKGSPSDVYMIQLESFIPSDDMEQRCKVSPGVIFIYRFAPQALEDNIHVSVSAFFLTISYVTFLFFNRPPDRTCVYFLQTATRAILAMANGYVTEQQVLGHAEWGQLEEYLIGFDHTNAIWSNVKQSRKPKLQDCVPRTLKTTDMLKSTTDAYVMYAEAAGETLEEHIAMFDAAALFGGTCRLKRLYQDLLSYAAWRSEANEFSRVDVLPTRQNLILAVHRLETEDALLTRQLRLLKWEVARHEGNEFVLDLSAHIAWRIDPQHFGLELGFFFKHRLYELGMDEDVLRRGLNMLLKRKRDDEGRRQRQNTFAYDAEREDEEERRRELKHRRIAYNIGMDHRPQNKCNSSNNSRTDFELKYPLLSEAKEVFRQLAVKHEEDLTAYFVLSKNSEFMLHHFDQLMRSETIAGVARKRQYQYMDALHEMFDHGHLNSVSGTFSSPMCIRRTADVEPSQDIMVQHLLCMAKAGGVLQLTVEFVMFLLGNVIGFTCHDNKPIVCLNGPPGAGKSHTALAAMRIAVGSDICVNNAAFESQDYATIRASAATRENEYDRVSGTKFIEEWQSGDGGDNKFCKDTSIEATTFKNIWDKGMINTERCIKKDKSDRIVAEKHYSLYSQNIIVLVNGIELPPSLKDRFLIYDVPHLKVEVHSVDKEQMTSRLEATRLGHLFALYRFHVSEGINRRTIGLEIKEKAFDSDWDEYETRLTFCRMHQVLGQMNLPKDFKKLNPRLEKQIRLFAEVISRWRAVTEVLGFGHPSTMDGEARPLDADRDRLRTLTEHSKTLMIEQRTVMDPADLVSAATMVLCFTDPAMDVLKAITEHLLDPEVTEVYKENTDYFKISTSVKQILADLKTHDVDFLELTVTNALSSLESRTTVGSTGKNVPIVSMSSSSRKDRFDLLVEANAAGLAFCNARPDLMRRAEQFMVNRIADPGNGVQHDLRQLRAYKDSFTFKIPADLIRTFEFLYHVHDVRCMVEQKDKDVFVVTHRFGLLLLKVAKALAVQQLKRKVAAGDPDDEEPYVDDEGYISVPIDTDDKNYTFNGNRRMPPTVGGSWVPLLKAGGRRVHLAGLTFLPPPIRRKMIEVLDTVEDGYVRLPEGVRLPTPLPASVSIAQNDGFRCDGEHQLKVHYMLLDSMPLLHMEKVEEESLPITFARRMLCKDLTSMKTVLCFDRETCYKEQRMEDAFVFIPVPPRDELPEFSVPQRVSHKQGFNEKTSAERGQGYCTFHPEHMRMKLAYKQLLLKGAIQKARKDFPSHRSEEGMPGGDSVGFVETVKNQLCEENVLEFTPRQLTRRLKPFPQSIANLYS